MGSQISKAKFNMKFLIFLQLNAFTFAFPTATTSTTEELTTTTVPETTPPTTDSDWTTPRTTTATEEYVTDVPMTSVDGGWTAPSFSTTEPPTPPAPQTTVPTNPERVCTFYIFCSDAETTPETTDSPKPCDPSMPCGPECDEIVDEEVPGSFWGKLWENPTDTFLSLFGYGNWIQV